MKKLWFGLSVIAIAILSGSFLSRFLNWAGNVEIFDFDLDEDIDLIASTSSAVKDSYKSLELLFTLILWLTLPFSR